ncbi:queuosine precursor transporter [Tuberibacillus sp. Marseille-P3662]|uniref:queuosine precursor transporter n=1 Tax=Tuberibacillus sp. Marseille-P3662 TaxID=1965358 RepID=UPI000A1CB8BA|nr:queuosine precursor transporter [Tuberibacillus sp. Marseille-P3662]
MSKKWATLLDDGNPIKLMSLVMMFMVFIMTANIAAVKMFHIGAFTMTAGIIMYPVTSLILDSITEIWGRRLAQRVVWIGLAGNVLMLILFQFAIHLPPAETWAKQDAFAGILGSVPRTVAASLSAYILSQTFDVRLFANIKKQTKGKMLWLRSWGSTAVSQLIDTSVFMFVAFLGVMPVGTILTAIFSEYTIKFSYAVIGTPIVYLVVKWAKR